MDFKALKLQMIRGALARRIILACLCFVLAMFIVSFTRIAGKIRTNEPVLMNFDQCWFNRPRMKVSNVCHENLTFSVVKELTDRQMLRLDGRALCVGDNLYSDALSLRELGFMETFRANQNTIMRFEHDVEFETNYFDFVLSRTFGKVPIPARLVLEIERVLRPGGIGVMIVDFDTFNIGSLVRSATPVSLLLRSSNILHVCGIGSFALIVFKKNLSNVVYFENFRLPKECPSVLRNKPFMQHIEPLMEYQDLVSYLPNFVNVSSRNKLIYINMGTGEMGPSYPIHPQAFNVYVVDHNVSALSAHVKKPGVTFVYHPGLVEGDNFGHSVNSAKYMEAPLHEKRFEFIKWLKETAKDGDFVVLKMNAGETHLKVLFELFESGVICHVDEMFVHCSEGVDCRNSRCHDCLSLFKGLRNAGVFVHRSLQD
ncbi:uncharacterized protein [Rutidosis leptorrhynchoides]|uniref:uncharacterized protein n=1 Tax=Rutidosis leptorrhynchoides TaxID=125765 RepID=UPI003A99270C